MVRIFRKHNEKGKIFVILKFVLLCYNKRRMSKGGVELSNREIKSHRRTSLQLRRKRHLPLKRKVRQALTPVQTEVQKQMQATKKQVLH